MRHWPTRREPFGGLGVDEPPSPVVSMARSRLAHGRTAL
ncbi:hypothetical protein A7982_13645 [Minicystis rosea]|nr:hypothetical protein A7982_13645 [Minicystis rosea]